VPEAKVERKSRRESFVVIGVSWIDQYLILITAKRLTAKSAEFAERK